MSFNFISIEDMDLDDKLKEKLTRKGIKSTKELLIKYGNLLEMGFTKLEIAKIELEVYPTFPETIIIN